MNEVVDFLKQFNFQTLAGMAVICWYFSRDLKSSIDKLDDDVRKMNSRVSRLEGTVYGKDVYKIEDVKE